MIRLLVGDNMPRKDSITLEKLSINKLRTKQLTKARFIIDLDMGRFDIRKFKRILKACTVDLDIRTTNPDRIKQLQPLVNRIEYMAAVGGMNIFHLLMAIFSHRKRGDVFKELEYWKPPLEVLLKWIISNIDEDDRENIKLLNTIDRYLYKVNPKIIHLLLAHFKPKYSPLMRFNYRFKKREKK